MQAVLMAGGKGTRLRPITAVLPKPLVPIGEISVLEMVLRQLRRYGFHEVILCVGHKAELIMAVVGDGVEGLRVRYHVEEQPLGTMGALAELDGLEESFLVMNGDTCTDLDFRVLLEHHRAHGGPATFATTRRREKIELGVLELDENRRMLTGFREKPTYDFWVAMGVNALDRRVLELIPRGELFGFDDLTNEMLAREWPVEVFPFKGFWLDIGRIDDYERMVDEFPRLRSRLLPDLEGPTPAPGD